MVLGAALVLAALSLFLWNRQEASAADAAAADALAQVDAYIATNESAASDPYSIEMTEVEIDGHSYIGYLSLPTENLELPVMSDWNYALRPAGITAPSKPTIWLLPGTITSGILAPSKTLCRATRSTLPIWTA